MVLLGTGETSVSAQADTRWLDKVDPSVLQSVRSGAETQVLVLLTEQADLSAARTLSGKSEKGRHVYEALRTTADRTQRPLRGLLDGLGVPYRSFWVANMILLRADLDLVELLARRADVSRLSANASARLSLPEAPSESLDLAAPDGIEWNITQIGAPDYWNAGYTGQGVVIAGQDTGYLWDHPALREQYRGWNGVSADHDYSWHDSIHSGGGSCGADSPEPCDDGNHGTHTMGTMIGDDGGANQIGVAPGARWIGCRNMDRGNGTPATYAECFEFFIAPTRVDGSDPDPSKAPHVINNSWSCPPSEGCTDPSVLQTVVENTRAAGIVVVVSAGNSGSGCGSVSTPSAIYEDSLTVGATNSSDSIASFSSRGAVTVDGSQRMKPNVTAPGVGIRSSLANGGYSGQNWSGTSMAGPHVAGQVALLISAVPELAGRVEALETCIEATAIPLTSFQDCSGFSGDLVPNNTYGRGRIQLTLPLPFECSAAFVSSQDFETGAAYGWE